LFVIYVVALLAFSSRRARAKSAVGVVRQLRTREKHKIRLSRLDLFGTWNPAEPPASFSRVTGSGVAVYWRDHQDRIHLDWTPKSGNPQHFAGPVPASPARTVARRRRSRTIAWMITGLYAGTLGIGLHHRLRIVQRRNRTPRAHRTLRWPGWVHRGLLRPAGCAHRAGSAAPDVGTTTLRTVNRFVGK
jgi:hypothetical protein